MTMGQRGANNGRTVVNARPKSLETDGYHRGYLQQYWNDAAKQWLVVGRVSLLTCGRAQLEVWAILRRAVSRRANQSNRGSGLRARDDIHVELRTLHVEGRQREHEEGKISSKSQTDILGTRFSCQFELQSRDAMSDPCVAAAEEAASIFNLGELNVDILFCHSSAINRQSECL